MFVAVILGLLCLIAPGPSNPLLPVISRPLHAHVKLTSAYKIPAAASALFSLAVAGNNLAWGIPIFARAVWGQKKFTPGPFHTGRFSIPIAWAAVVFLAFGITLAMFPTEGPDPTAENMNYTVVVNMAVWGGATLYYLVDARKWFTGPRTTLEEVSGVAGQLTEEQKQELVKEGLVLGDSSDRGEVGEISDKTIQKSSGAE